MILLLFFLLEKLKREDPESFANAMSKILGSHLKAHDKAVRFSSSIRYTLCKSPAWTIGLLYFTLNKYVDSNLFL